MSTTGSEIYNDFIRYAIEEGAEVPASAKDIDWKDFLEYCNRQCIIGLVFYGLQKSGLRIPQKTLFEWIGFAESLKVQNMLLNKRIGDVTGFFDKRIIRSCILKGQANGLMYPKPELRSPGDIDIWVDGCREDIIKMVLEASPEAHYSIHHVKMPVFKDVSVEVHYRPMYLSNWFADRKLQRYISSIEERQFNNFANIDVNGVETKIGTLTNDFNMVYQILHMYHHFFETRNNFKQFIDYYYLLKKGHAEDVTKITERFREFGVMRYAKGVMWVMKELLGLEENYLVAEPSEKEGRLILKESFYFGTWSTNKLRSVIEIFIANLRIVTHYPKEVLINPLFLIWHQWWKMKMKWILKH